LDESDDKNAQVNPKSSVVDRLQSSSIEKRPSVFTHIGKSKDRKVYVFNRIKDGLRPKPLVFTRIQTIEKPSDSSLQQEKISAFSCLGVINEVQSSIPSRMKRFSTLDVKMDGSLRVKMRTVVLTRQQKSYSSNEKSEEEQVASSNHITIRECDDSDLDSKVDLAEILDMLEDEGLATVDDLKELNLGTKEESRPIYVSSLLMQEEEKEYFDLLSEYKDVLAWSYKEMPGLDPKVAVHRLSIKKGVSPKKQPQRRFRPELVLEIKKEVNKLIEVGFIREVKYLTWIANIVLMRKKNGQLHICLDFRDLNKACPKDDFPLPIMELMIDLTTGHEALSFMDCTTGYNQIQMALEDQEATTFRTAKGIFFYKVMPFDIKNAGPTYQRAIQTIFDDRLHKIVKFYVDDLVVKSMKRVEHIRDLRQIFERL